MIKRKEKKKVSSVIRTNCVKYGKIIQYMLRTYKCRIMIGEKEVK